MPAQNEPAQATVHVIDDDAAVRKSLGLLLELRGYRTRLYASGRSFLDSSPSLQGACAIFDLRMPGGMDGLQLQQEINALGLKLPVIFLSGQGDIPSTVKALKAGAVDFLTKPIQGDILLASVQAALAAGTSVEPASERPYEPDLLDRLSERERQVTRMALEGKTNKDIGRLLDISHRTVELHRAHALQKFGARNILELARILQITPGTPAPE